MRRYRSANCLWIPAVAFLCATASALSIAAQTATGGNPSLDRQLATTLASAGFTGTIQSTLERRLGRTVRPELAELGRLIWFDKFPALFHDNACGACHSPTNGFGDTQSIAIGIQ